MLQSKQLPFVIALCGLILVSFKTKENQMWSAHGHRTIAAMTYQLLPAEQQIIYSDLLRHHPEFPNWEDDYREDSGVPFDEFLFMRASVWPDEIRSRGGAGYKQWLHYTNYPLRPPSFRFEETMTPNDDVLDGIAAARKSLGDQSVGIDARAISLAWLLHLVGDLHQPLHVVALVNETYPEGDRGGNSFFVMPRSAGVNLHAYWDGVLGRARNPREARQDAILLRNKFPVEQLEELNDTSVESWARASRDLAVEKVYLNGELAGDTDRDNAPLLPDGYNAQAKAAAERQAALAGYRLVQLLS